MDFLKSIQEKYEAQYKAVLTKYRQAIKKAGDLKPDLQEEAEAKARQEALTAAKQIKSAFIGEVNAEIKKQEAAFRYEKWKQPLATTEEKILNKLDLLLTHHVLGTGSPELIEARFEEQKSNPQILQTMRAVLKGKEGFEGLMVKINEATMTDLDRLEEIKGLARLWNSQGDVLPTSIVPHNFKEDFGFNAVARNLYFGNTTKE